MSVLSSSEGLSEWLRASEHRCTLTLSSCSIDRTLATAVAFNSFRALASPAGEYRQFLETRGRGWDEVRMAASQRVEAHVFSHRTPVLGDDVHHHTHLNWDDISKSGSWVVVSAAAPSTC